MSRMKEKMEKINHRMIDADYQYEQFLNKQKEEVAIKELEELEELHMLYWYEEDQKRRMFNSSH